MNTNAIASLSTLSLSTPPRCDYATADLLRGAMANKRERQRVILELIEAHSIGNQEDLRLMLERRGAHATQATLSRDLHELGVSRVPFGEGHRYQVVREQAGDSKPLLYNLLPQLFSSIDGVGELIVLHTLSGGAQPIAEAIDAQKWPEALGTLAGENTVLIICRSHADRATLSQRLEDIASGSAVD